MNRTDLYLDFNLEKNIFFSVSRVIMYKINVFQNETDVYEEFWYQHCKCAIVTAYISFG